MITRLILTAAVLQAQPIIIDCGSATDKYFSGGLSWTQADLGADTTLRYSASPATGFSYSIPSMVGGTFKVTSEEPNQSTVGARVFSASTTTDSNPSIDLVKLAGLKMPYTYTLNVVPINGFVMITFTALTPAHGAVVSSLEFDPAQTLGIAAPAVVAPPSGPGPCPTTYNAVAQDAVALYYCLRFFTPGIDPVPLWLRCAGTVCSTSW